MEKKQSFIYLENTTENENSVKHVPISLVGRQRVSVCHSYLTESEVKRITMRARGLWEVFVEPEIKQNGPSRAYCDCLLAIIVLTTAMLYFL